MLSDFARFQPAENRLVPPSLQNAGVAWILELAPSSSPSPAMAIPRIRCLMGSEGLGWPVKALAGQLPFADESLPAVLVRHLNQPGCPAGLYREIARCLMPGGLLVSVSANPWHPAAWRTVGRQAVRLPGAIRLQVLHMRLGLRPQPTGARVWRQMLPMGSRLVLVSSRKPPRPGTVRRVQFRQPASGSAATAAVSSWCRAA